MPAGLAPDSLEIHYQDIFKKEYVTKAIYDGNELKIVDVRIPQF